MIHFSFAVTAYEEMCDARRQGHRLLEAIQPAQAHDAIEEIVVVDDGSSDFDRLAEFLKGQPKVHCYHNFQNQGVFANKIEAIAWTTGEWVITCDSDNRMGKAFLDRVTSVAVNPRCWYCPSFAKPEFDYRKLIGSYSLNTPGYLALMEKWTPGCAKDTHDFQNIGAIMDKPMFECAMNTGNQTVHRDSFMQVFGKYRGKRADLMMPNWLGLSQEQRREHYWRLVFDACDSFILNLEWLRAGECMRIVEGMEYDHYYTGGETSNYARSPKEKEDLSRLLIAELRRLAK